MKNLYDIINTPLLTEKTTRLSADNQYVFEVSTAANKIEIKQAVEKIYNVKVKSIRVANFAGKKKRIRYKEGYTSSWKKAIVTLKEGHKIDIS